ncbi:hypothetical protein [Atlantibacter hermannii]|uniref:hypothetical protein n=1 Tax=Atlantibacter hermannii TaxID=565 RepID=UPI0028AE6BEE|nr:hypothetical protein [Atlantibacter hermannii]
MSRHSHTTARIEKKISKTAKELLIALFPSLVGNEFSLESDSFKSYHGTVYHDEWVIWFGPDYWGEWDESSCYFQLYSWLIDNTTDFDGIMKAHEEADWSVSIDETPFYSPWRGASRAEIISHCRDLVRAGVTLDRMK